MSAERNLNLLAHEAAKAMGDDGRVTLEPLDGSTIEGALEAMPTDRDWPVDGSRNDSSNVILQIRLEDVADVRREHAELRAELKQLRAEREALLAAMKRAVALVPPVAAADLRATYRKVRGGFE